MKKRGHEQKIFAGYSIQKCNLSYIEKTTNLDRIKNEVIKNKM